MDYDAFSNAAQSMIELLENRKKIRSYIHGNGTKVIVGKENPLMELTDSSMIICNYKIGDQNGGAVGIVGPVNMDYAKIIPHMEYFTDMLAKILRDIYE